MTTQSESIDPGNFLRLFTDNYTEWNSKTKNVRNITDSLQLTHMY